MTYPNGAPAGYDPSQVHAQQQAPAGYQPPMAPQFTPPQYPQQPAQQQPSMPAGDPFSDPTGGQAYPKLRNLQGRTVIAVPLMINEQATDPSGKPRPSCTLDLIICDGGQLTYGDDEDKKTPATHQIDTPALFRGITLSNMNFVGALRGSVGRGPVIGVIQQSNIGRRPYNLVKLSAFPDGEQRRANAAVLWSRHLTGEQPWPTPVELAGAAAPSYPQGYGQQSAQPYGYPPQAQPAWAGPAAGQPGYPVQPVTGPPPGYVPQGQTSAAPANVQVHQPAPVAQTSASGAPHGWPPEVWAQMTPEQQQQILSNQPSGQQPASAGHPGF